MFDFSDILSGSAIFISGLTFYLVYLWKGKIKMTTPSQIWFGVSNDQYKRPYVFIKTLLYSTSLQGQIIETMYARVSRNEAKQNFSNWCIGFGTSQSQLGGLKIHGGGVLTDNVFIAPNDESSFKYASGKYKIEIFARTVGKQNSIKLQEINLTLPTGLEKKIAGKTVIQFYLQSNGKTYHPSEGTIPRDINEEFSQTFSRMMNSIESFDSETKADVTRRSLGLMK